jgi:hypothetical protein
MNPHYYLQGGRHTYTLTPVPPMPHRMRPPHMDVARWPVHPVGAAHLPRGNIAPWPTRPAGAACLPRWPKPFLALQLPVDAAPPKAPCASSSPAHIADVQERHHIAVAAKSGGRAGCGGGGGNATGRWCGLPPSIVQEQRFLPSGDEQPPHQEGADDMQSPC